MLEPYLHPGPSLTTWQVPNSLDPCAEVDEQWSRSPRSPEVGQQGLGPISPASEPPF